MTLFINGDQFSFQLLGILGAMFHAQSTFLWSTPWSLHYGTLHFPPSTLSSGRYFPTLFLGTIPLILHFSSYLPIGFLVMNTLYAMVSFSCVQVLFWRPLFNSPLIGGSPSGIFFTWHLGTHCPSSINVFYVLPPSKFTVGSTPFWKIELSTQNACYSCKMITLHLHGSPHC